MRLIEDYAMIGDCETAALISRNGSLDWLCWPRFDSSACFAALLGTPEHGRWSISPVSERVRVSRRYAGETLILETVYETAEGVVRLTDFMPVRTRPELSEIVRIVSGVRGKVRMRMEFDLRFDYGRIRPWLTWAGPQLRAIAGPHAARLTTPFAAAEAGGTSREFTVNAGDRLPFTLSYEASHLPAPEMCDPEAALEQTERFWTAWAGQCRYTGPWREAVIRSLITVKALTYRPTGAIVAAPTTSLPEMPGGERNWDYRYCWLRDASFSLQSLIRAGYREEAGAWGNWLLRAVAGDPSGVQPVYGIGGEYRLPEQDLGWLPGFEGSRPVRTGNAAFRQLQTDVFGSVLDAVLDARRAGLEMHEDWAGLIDGLLRYLTDLWHKPDEGIWEVRGGRRHFVHSKLMAWVAFDRAVRLAEEFGMPGPVDQWKKERLLIRRDILEKGFDKKRGIFVQAYGSGALDAAALLMPLMGFLAADDPRMTATREAIEAELSEDGLLRRYDPGVVGDGLNTGEGAFLACSFWLADNLMMAEDRDRAEALFRRLISLRNDVGLLAEQFDPHRQVQLGNFPQAFSHFALIDTALRIAG